MSEINPTCDAQLAPALQSRGRPESDTWGTRARQTSALARGKQSRRAPGIAGSGIPASGLSPAHRLGSRGTDLPDMPKGLGREPREEAGETVPASPGHPQRGPASLRPGREPHPRRSPERFPSPDWVRYPGSCSVGTCPGAARAPSPSRRFCRGGGQRSGPPLPVTPEAPVRAAAEARRRRQAGTDAAARLPGPHSPCPRRGPSPGPPPPRIVSAPRRPPPPAAAASGRGAGGGRRCPAGTGSRRYSRYRSRCRSCCASGCGSRCSLGCGAAGGGQARSAGQRPLHPAPAAAAGVKFQPPSPDRRGGHRDPHPHRHRDPDRHPDPHRSGTGTPTRTGAGTTSRPGEHRDPASSRRRGPTRISTGSAPGSAPPPNSRRPPAAPDHHHLPAGRAPAWRTPLGTAGQTDRPTDTQPGWTDSP